MNKLYQPSLGFDTSETALAGLHVDSWQRSIIALHAAAPALHEQFQAEADEILADPALTDAGKRTKLEEALKTLVTDKLVAHGKVLELHAAKAAETRGAILRKAAASAGSELRSLTLAAWLRDLSPERRFNALHRAIELGDIETLASALSAPRAWDVVPASMTDRLTETVIGAVDPERAASLVAQLHSIQAVAESFEAVQREATSRLPPRPIEPAPRPTILARGAAR